jgi:hypothetical protein
MYKQRRTFNTVRIRFGAELLNHLPGLMLTPDNHCTIHFRILKVFIVKSTSITNRGRTTKLIEETMLINSKTNYLIKRLSSHRVSLDYLSILHGPQRHTGTSQTVSKVAQQLTIRTLLGLMMYSQPNESRGMLDDELIATEPATK